MDDFATDARIIIIWHSWDIAICDFDVFCAGTDNLSRSSARKQRHRIQEVKHSLARLMMRLFSRGIALSGALDSRRAAFHLEVLRHALFVCWRVLWRGPESKMTRSRCRSRRTFLLSKRTSERRACFLVQLPVPLIGA